MAVILVLSVLMRFTWDVVPQMILHVMVLFLLSSMIINREYLDRQMSVLCAAVIAAAVVSSVGNGNTAVMRNTIWVLIDGMIFFAAASMLSEEAREKLAAVVVIVAGFLSVITLSYAAAHAGDFPVDVLVNRNVVAAYLVLSLPLMLWVAKRFQPRVSFVMVAIHLAGIAACWSRAAVLISVITLLFWYRMNNRLSRKLFVAIVAAGCILISVIMRDKLSSSSMSERAIWAKTALTMFVSHPASGIGWGNYADRYLNFRPELSRNTAYAHDMPLQIAAESGLIGILAFGALLCFIVIRVRARLRDPFALATTVSLGAFLLYECVDFSFYIPSHQIAFFTIAGMAVALPDQPGKPTRSSGSAWKVFLFATVSCAGFAAYRVAAGNIYAAQARHFLVQERLSQAQEKVLAAQHMDRSDATYHSLAGEIEMAVYRAAPERSRLSAAINELNKAAALNPYRAQTWFDLYWVYRLSSDDTQARAALDKAIAADPHNQKYRSLSAGGAR